MILVIIILTLVMIFFSNAFESWYMLFLEKMEIKTKAALYLKRIIFILLAFIVWEFLVSGQYAASINFSHFLFSFFIYALYKFFDSFRKNNP